MLNSILEMNITVFLKYILCAITSVGAGFLTAIIYKVYKKKFGYTSDMPASIVILPVIVMVIALVSRSIGLESSDLRTTIGFSFAGIIAIMRFRSYPKDAVDLVFISASIILGFLSGLGYLLLVLITLAILIIIVIVLHLSNFSLSSDKCMTLKITIPEDLNYDHLFDEILKTHCDNWTFKSSKLVEFGTLYELSFFITIKKNTKIKDLIDKIREKNANLNVSINLANFDSK